MLSFSKKSIDSKNLLKYNIVMFSTITILIFVFFLSLVIGRYHINFFESVKIIVSRFIHIDKSWDDLSESVIFTLRLPRTIAAILVGMALSVSGATYQSIFRNPMCAPDLLGVSSGACVGAAIAILFDGTSFVIQSFAFVFGIVAVFITILIPKMMRNNSTTILILSGIVVSSLMSSIISFIKSVADADTKLAEITYWTMGSFANVNIKNIIEILPFILPSVIIIVLMRYRLNVLSLGDKEAKTLGVNLNVTRNIFIVCSTIATASCVCISGTIGWVGLIIPHVSRILIGSDNKKMIPLSITIGAIFMLIIDILCRTLSTQELKISILTGIIGAPFFILILAKQKRELD